MAARRWGSRKRYRRDAVTRRSAPVRAALLAATALLAPPTALVAAIGLSAASAVGRRDRSGHHRAADRLDAVRQRPGLPLRHGPRAGRLRAPGRPVAVAGRHREAGDGAGRPTGRPAVQPRRPGRERGADPPGPGLAGTAGRRRPVRPRQLRRAGHRRQRPAGLRPVAGGGGQRRPGAGEGRRPAAGGEPRTGTMAADCRTRYPTLFADVDTTAAARDMDRIRQALGVVADRLLGPLVRDGARVDVRPPVPGPGAGDDPGRRGGRDASR